MNYRMLIITAAFPLAACESFKMPFPVIPPANLTAQCPDLVAPQGEVTLGDLLRFSVDTAGQYRECQARHKALSEWAVR